MKSSAESGTKMIEHFQSGFAPKLIVFDDIFAKQEFMGGTEFSLIDIYYLSYAQKIFDASDRHIVNDRLHLKRWWESVSSRESWKKVLEMGRPVSVCYASPATM